AGSVIAAAVCLAIGILCWKTRDDSTSSERFKLVVPLILAANIVISPVWHEYDVLFLLPAALLGIQWRHLIRKMRPLAGAIITTSALILAWQWIAATIVAAVSLISPLLAERWTVLPWLPVFLAPLPVLFSLF